MSEKEEYSEKYTLLATSESQCEKQAEETPRKNNAIRKVVIFGVSAMVLINLLASLFIVHEHAVQSYGSMQEHLENHDFHGVHGYHHDWKHKAGAEDVKDPHHSWKSHHPKGGKFRGKKGCHKFGQWGRYGKPYRGKHHKGDHFRGKHHKGEHHKQEHEVAETKESHEKTEQSLVNQSKKVKSHDSDSDSDDE